MLGIVIYFQNLSLTMELSIGVNFLEPGIIAEECTRTNLKIFVSVNTECLS